MKLPIFVALAAEENPYTYLNPGGIAFNLTVLLVGLLLGGLLAAIVTVFHQRLVNRFFAALRRAEANDKKSAKTLEEIGIKPLLGMRRALLSRTSIVRKLTSVVLPDGRVIEPIHSLDDDLAAAMAEDSAIHAEDPTSPPIARARYTPPGAAVTEVAAEGGAAESAAESAKNGASVTESAAESAKNGASVTEGAAEAALPTATEGGAAHFDVMTAAYFLDDLHRRRAEIRFEKRGNDLRFLIPAIIAFVALFATLPVYLPYFAKMLDTLLATILGGGA